jgi:acetyl-CoA synthetase
VLFNFAQDFPKRRSGKIMRRILKKIAQNETDDLGDTSTLADPSVIDSLLQK